MSDSAAPLWDMTTMAAPCHYGVLGVRRHSTNGELRATLKHQVLELHPDCGGTKQAFTQALLAFETLLVRRNGTQCQAQLAHTARQPECQQWGTFRSCANGDAKRRRCQREPLLPGHTMVATTVPSPKVSGRRCDGPGDERGSQHKQAFLMSKIFALLKRLPAARRRLALETQFTEPQRLALEAWAISSSEATASTSSGAGRAGKRNDEGAVKCRGGPQSSSTGSVLEVRGIGSCHDGMGSDAGSFAPAALRNNDATCHAEHGNEQSLGTSEGAAKRGPPEITNPNCSSFPSIGTDKGVRGVAWKWRRSGARYQANVCVEALYFIAREVPDLQTALDDLVVLTSIKQRILMQGSRRDACNEFESRVRAAVPAALEAHGMSAEELGLRFHVMVSMRFWIRPPLHTPQQQSLERALHAWGRLNGFRQGYARIDPLVRQSQWVAFREAYLGILAEQGQDVVRSAARLDALEEVWRPHRERQIAARERTAVERTARVCAARERAEGAAMAKEERRQCRAEAFERRQASKVTKTRGCRAIEANEGNPLRQKGCQGTASARIIRRVTHLLGQWQRTQGRGDRREAAQRAKIARRDARVERQRACMAARARKRAATAECAMARASAWQRREEQAACWRQVWTGRVAAV